MKSGRTRLGIEQTMRVFEASISYNLVQLGEDIPVDSAEKAAEYLKSAFAVNPAQESFWVILLNRKNRAIGRVMISLGTATAALAHPREVFRPAILANACCAIIVAHNHPSGDPAPSAPDLHVTRQLREAAKILQIDLIDHVIVGYAESDPKGVGHFSFREAGIL